jgi:hypothetical protein
MPLSRLFILTISERCSTGIPNRITISCNVGFRHARHMHRRATTNRTFTIQGRTSPFHGIRRTVPLPSKSSRNNHTNFIYVTLGESGAYRDASPVSYNSYPHRPRIHLANLICHTLSIFEDPNHLFPFHSTRVEHNRTGVTLNLLYALVHGHEIAKISAID